MPSPIQDSNSGHRFILSGATIDRQKTTAVLTSPTQPLTTEHFVKDSENVLLGMVTTMKKQLNASPGATPVKFSKPFKTRRVHPVLGETTVAVQGPRERKAPKRLAEEHMHRLFKIPKLSPLRIVWTPIIHFLASASAGSTEANLCDCLKQRFIRTIDQKHYLKCEQPHEQPHLHLASYSLYALKRKTATFTATVCKAMSQSIRVDPKFLNMLNTDPSSKTGIL